MPTGQPSLDNPSQACWHALTGMPIGHPNLDRALQGLLFQATLDLIKLRNDTDSSYSLTLIYYNTIPDLQCC